MPIHDWTLVRAGIFHAFHQAWIVHMSEALNAGVLPSDYYALPEQIAGPVGPDVLTLQASSPQQPGLPQNGAGGPRGATALATVAPRARFTGTLGTVRVRRHQPRNVAIRHVSDDRLVALIEIVSPSNKSSRDGVRAFIDKATTVLSRGIHLLLVDLFPPTLRDPNGMPGAIAAAFGESPYAPPEDRPLLLASYAAGLPSTVYIEPVAVGDVLPDMPLFLLPDWYVNAPLERSYQQAWAGVPQRWRDVLAPPASP
jgi:hypothetical protein